MKFIYFNDTGRAVSIHPATFTHGCSGSEEPIKPLEEGLFVLPKGTFPWVKMWDNGEKGLSILISPIKKLIKELNKVDKVCCWLI
jgi:hypothetical protein